MSETQKKSKGVSHVGIGGRPFYREEVTGAKALRRKLRRCGWSAWY